MSNSPEPHTRNKNETKIELDLSNYATKSALKMQQVLIMQNLLKMLNYLN